MLDSVKKIFETTRVQWSSSLSTVWKGYSETPKGYSNINVRWFLNYNKDYLNDIVLN